MLYTAVIEQTRAYEKRMHYMPATGTFEPKDCMSLSFERGVPFPSGWIKESGTPPCEHLDVIVVTGADFELGDEIGVRVIGVFCNSGGDHKLVAVPADREISDISALPEEEFTLLRKLYPSLGRGEGWFGREKAGQVISDFSSRRKRKIIITVQHAESVHHVNGHIGAWGDWELTERGRQQAFEIGKRLLREGGNRGFVMYASDLKRAYQTAEEINKTLGITPTVTDVIREVNAGAGNGQTRDWYREHEAPRPKDYDPDFRPFPDAESDRNLWNRLLPFCEMITTNDEERILIVSHGTALSFLQSMLLGYKLEDRGRFRFYGRSGSVSQFIIEPDGMVIVKYLNN